MKNALKVAGLVLAIAALIPFSIYMKALELKLSLWLIGR